MSADTGKKMEKRPKASLCCSLTPYHFTPKACTNKAFKVFPKTQKTASYTPCNRKIIHTLNAAIIALRATFFLQLYTETLAPSVVCFPWFSLLVSTCPAVVSGPQVSPYRWSGCLFFSTRLVLWYVYVLFFLDWVYPSRNIYAFILWPSRHPAERKCCLFAEGDTLGLSYNVG